GAVVPHDEAYLNQLVKGLRNPFAAPCLEPRKVRDGPYSEAEAADGVPVRAGYQEERHQGCAVAEKLDLLVFPENLIHLSVAHAARTPSSLSASSTMRALSSATSGVASSHSDLSRRTPFMPP